MSQQMPNGPAITPVPMNVDIVAVPVPQAPGGGFVQMVFSTPLGVFAFFIPKEASAELRAEIEQAEMQIGSGLVVPDKGIIHPNGSVRPIKDNPQA